MKSHFGEPPQVDALAEVAAREDVRMAVITVGANDVGFGGLVADCALDWARSSEPHPRLCRADAQVELDAALPSMQRGLRRVLALVRAALAAAGERPADYRLVVMGYASPFPAGRWIRYPEAGWDRLNAGGCPVWNADADWAAGPGVGSIDAAMRAAAGAAGAEFLDVRDALAGHQLCDRRSRRVGAGGPSPVTSEWVRRLSFLQGSLARVAAPERLRPAGAGRLHRPALRRPARRLRLPGRAGPQLRKRNPPRKDGMMSWSILMAMKRLRISAGGQVSVPAAVRQRWKTKVVVAEDRGDHLILRPAPEDPIEAARGAFAHLPGPTVDEARRLDREEEAEIEEEKFRAEGGS